MSKKIIVLETSDVAARYSALAIRQAGFEPLFLLSSLKNYQADTRAQLLEFDVLECANTQSAEAILRALADYPAESIEAVVTLLDSRLAVAQEVAKALGVKGLDPALQRIAEKTEVMALVPEFSPRSAVLVAGQDFLALDAMKSAQRLIVKPSRGAGAIGYAEFVQGPQREALIEQHVTQQAAKLGVDSFLVQEHLTGQLVSLEGYVTQGVCHFLGFSLRKKIENTESANLFPGDSHLSSTARETARQAITTLVARSGFRQGYFHSEFIVSGDEARLIDANFGRIAGAAISEQMAIAFGMDPVDLFRHVIGIGCLGETDALNVGKVQETLSICYGLVNEETLQRLELPAVWDLRHTQLLDEQTLVPAMGGDNWAWLGLASGPADKVLEQIDQIRLVTTAGTKAPHYLKSGQSLSSW